MGAAKKDVIEMPRAKPNGKPMALPAASDTTIGRAWRPLDADLLLKAPPIRRWLFRHPTRNGGPCAPGEGDGFFPLGKAGMLVADGGVGKTNVIIEAAISIVTGRRWLDHFEIGREARGRRVLLLLAEEDDEEVHRRLYNVARAIGLSPDECRHVAARVIALALAGSPVALAAPGPEGRICATAELVELRRRLDDGGDPWAAICIDPLARVTEGEIEISNDAATKAVTAIESLVVAPGNPSVLVSHHSSLDGVQSGKAKARGVTGIRNAFRWEMSISVYGSNIELQQTKSNYSRPMFEPLRLVRDDDGRLRVASGDDDREREAKRESVERDRLNSDVARVVAALVGTQATSVDHVVELAMLGKVPGRVAVREAVRRGVVVKKGTKRDPVFVCGTDPHTPQGVEASTPAAPEGASASSRRPKAARGVEASRHWTEANDG